jgi:hypothetical protein
MRRGAFEFTRLAKRLESYVCRENERKRSVLPGGEALEAFHGQRPGSGLPVGAAGERDEERDESSGQGDRGRQSKEIQDYLVGHELTLLTEGREEPLHLRPIRVGRPSGLASSEPIPRLFPR